MSKLENDQMDQVDTLLTNAFDQALSGPGNQALIDQVMATIARRQRQRALVLTVFGLIAAVVCALMAAPLLAILQSLFSGLSGVPADIQLNLPVTLIVAAIAAAGSWLLLEEATT